MSEYNHETEENVQTESCSCNIANGGISVSINKDTFSKNGEVLNITPILVISGSNYGVQLTEIKLPTTPRSLRVLGEWLIEQSKSTEVWNKRSNSSHDFEFHTDSSENKPVYESGSG